MNVNVRVFDVIFIFMAALAIGYGVLTHLSRSGVELAGTTALTLSAGLAFFVATYLRFVNRRIDTLPEDYGDAEVSDGAGELGFFSPGSFWPVLMAFSIMVIGFGMAFWNWWVIIGGVVLLVIFVSGLVFEYHWGPEKH